MDNGAKITDGWADAYYVDFTQGGGERRPADRAVLRLLAGLHRRATARRPPARCSTPASARSSTPACWTAPTNPEGAEALVDFLLSPEVQEALPEQHVRLPGRRRTPSCPPDWAKFALAADRPVRRRPGRDRAHRDDWLREWSDVTIAMSRSRRLLSRLARAAPLRAGSRCSAVFFVLPVGGMLARGLLARRRVRPRRGRSRCWPARASHRVALVHALVRAGVGTALRRAARAAGGVRCSTGWSSPVAACCGRCCWCRSCCPTVVVGVAFRQLLGEAGRSASSASTGRRSRSSPAWCSSTPRS